ncbi:MAG: hypothetical protein ACK4ME_00395 [Fimbriimonadales bacterium]
MLTRLQIFGLSAVIVAASLSGAWAQGVAPAFTYQGSLRQGGNPVNNPSQPMTFRIYDALAGGTLLWNSGALTVNVQNGLFTVQLNAPATVWTGADRYLEIQVGSTTLSPRVRINPTPYANTATLLNMFQSGTTNPDRMVITHSPAFTDWGLQYRDNDDSFHFLGGGASRFRVGLFDGRIEIPGTLRIPTGAAAGRVLTSNASGDASWQDLPASASVWTVSGNNIYNSNTGSVGIGTTSPSYLLDLRGDRNARLMNIVNTNTGGSADGLYITVSGSTGWGLNSTANGADGVAVRASASGANAWAGFFIGRGYFSGNVGIGTSTLMTARLNVATDSTIDNATLRLHESANDFARLEFTNTNTARKWHIAGYIGSAVANDRLNFWNSSAGDIMSIRGDGTVAVKVLEITGADLAEKFPTTDAVEPGMVVEIDPDNPGHLRKAQGAYNRRVVGVVAGANGLSKGIVLGNLEGSESHTPIAMSGRVWVYADAAERAIEPGDFLTTADTPGYAMKADNLAQAQGAIIGKAMTRLEKGKTGMVLVVVNLQ